VQQRLSAISRRQRSCGDLADSAARALYFKKGGAGGDVSPKPDHPEMALRLPYGRWQRSC
jgi:hypothetical protein